MTRRMIPLPFAALALAAGIGAILAAPGPVSPVGPETVTLPGGPQDYRPAGEFRIATRIVDAPRERYQAGRVEVMKYPVSEADYARCMAASACPATATAGRADYPQTEVSHADARAFAAWLSDQTGSAWRLPSDAEWQRAAGDRAVDDALGAAASGSDPSRRWIAGYRRESALRRDSFVDEIHPLGHFGPNDLGVQDIGGNIWEWTETCFQNGTVAADGQTITSRADYCGVRAVQGRHRAFVIDFIRDARGGGCSAGLPPDHLGFRLVRDPAA